MFLNDFKHRATSSSYGLYGRGDFGMCDKGEYNVRQTLNMCANRYKTFLKFGSDAGTVFVK